MAAVKYIENMIYRTEGFKVDFIYNGANVRGDKIIESTYRNERASRGNWTVNEWIYKRFKPAFVGYDVRVYKGDGTVADPRMTLENVRNTYTM